MRAFTVPRGCASENRERLIAPCILTFRLLEPSLPKEEWLATEPAVVAVTVPWKTTNVEEGDQLWIAITDPEHREICRVPVLGDDPDAAAAQAQAYARMISALPWLMMAAKRTWQDLTRMEGLKNGVTVRQWVRNQEGYRRKEELQDAVERAWQGVTKPPPASYGIK